jgi:hypothetical protein
MVHLLHLEYARGQRDRRPLTRLPSYQKNWTTPTPTSAPKWTGKS